MASPRRYSSVILEAIHRAAVGLYQAGAISDELMREYDHACLEPPMRSSATTLAANQELVRLRAIEALGTPEKAAHWISTHNRAPGQPPASLLDTAEGTVRVLRELGRLKHGVVG